MVRVSVLAKPVVQLLVRHNFFSTSRFSGLTVRGSAGGQAAAAPTRLRLAKREFADSATSGKD